MPQNTLTAENAPIEKRFTLKEIRALTGTSHVFIYAEIKKGKLAPPEKWGRSSRWKESDVRAWLDTFSNHNVSKMTFDTVKKYALLGSPVKLRNGLKGYILFCHQDRICDPPELEGSGMLGVWLSYDSKYGWGDPESTWWSEDDGSNLLGNKHLDIIGLWLD